MSDPISGARALDGQVALVTGGNHGIGAAVAIALAHRGADVLLTYLRFSPSVPKVSAAYDEARARDGSDVVAAVEATGRRAIAVEADLTDADAIGGLFDRSEGELGPVGVLVHNASGWRKDTFSPSGVDAIGRAGDSVTASSIDKQLQVDARAGALLIAQYAERHRARGATWGRIVTMTSGTGGGFPGEVSYGAAKAALVSYTLSAASELAADGIAANVVHPPVTDTGWITDDVRAFVARDADHHHVARPDEVAEVVAWLCADANHLVTGNVIRLR
jgi:3-oxoacyl-[acyl-carrier protein] reductase